MALSFLFGRKYPPSFKISGIHNAPFLLEVDTAINETHNYNNNITSFPIENGSNITDHIQQQPETYSITGFVTNTPITILGIGQDKNRIHTAYEVLLSMAGFKKTIVNKNNDFKRENPLIIDIFTSMRIFTNMALTSLSIPRDKDTGNSLSFTASFRKIYVVSSATTKFKNIDKRKSNGSGKDGTSDIVKEKEDKGKKNVKKAKERTASYLKLGVKKFFGSKK